jgi:mRNA interferase RelE/StbE
MKWRVVFARTAEKELAKLASDIQLRIGKTIRSLEDDPFPAGAKRLKGREEFRIRVSDYRVLYTVRHDVPVVTISAIGHRREVYR